MLSGGTARGRITQPTIALLSRERFSGSVRAMLHPLYPLSGAVLHPVTMFLPDAVNLFVLLLSYISISPALREGVCPLTSVSFLGT